MSGDAHRSICDLPLAVTEEETIEAVARALCEADGVRPWKEVAVTDASDPMKGYRREAKRYLFAWRAMWGIVNQGRRP